MGAGHGKSIERKEEKTSLDLSKLQARVDRINIDGLSRTKDDIIVKAVNDLFKSRNFEEMLQKSHSVKNTLENLDCFQSIIIHIDTSSGSNASSDIGYEVTFIVSETKRMAGGIHTTVGTNNEGLVVASIKTPNILGRGERLQGEFSYGSKQTKDFNFTLSKPILLDKHFASVSGSIFNHSQEWPISSYKLAESGVLFNVNFFSLKNLKHSVQWEGTIRGLSVANRYTPFKVREHARHTLKSSFKHILTYDTRKSLIFPSSGMLTKVTSEFAGIGGNVGYMKNDMLLQLDIPLITDIALQGSIGGGFMIPIDQDKKYISLCDNFFLGGPVTFRGFEVRGAGPMTEGSFIGAKMFWAAGLSLFTPLPFRPSVGGFGEYFRTHIFANVGNIGNFNTYSNLSSFINQARLAYGIGLALRLGHFARIEINYCFPRWYQEGDRAVHGVQIGLGTSL